MEPVADDASIDDVQARFAPHGAVANVSLPRGRVWPWSSRRESAQKAVAALDGVDGVAVLTKGEWERIDRRWKDLSRSPPVAQARRRRRNVAEAAAPKLGGSKIRPGLPAHRKGATSVVASKHGFLHVLLRTKARSPAAICALAARRGNRRPATPKGGERHR